MTDNPSAFPHDLLRDDDAYPTHDASPGMTLRDYFAGQALAGIDGNIMSVIAAQAGNRGLTKDEAIGVYCYQAADAMLAARTGDA